MEKKLKKDKKIISDNIIKIMKCTNICINILILTLSIIILFFDSYKVSDIYKFIISCIMIVVQIISILLSNKVEETIEQSVFHMRRKDLFNLMKPYSDSISIQKARDELRYGLKILLSVAFALCCYMSIRMRNTYVFLEATLALAVTFIYADYLPHSLVYAESYDILYIAKNEKASAIRGLARIYLEEYDKTQFDRNNKLYKEISVYDETNIKKTTQDRCIKNILFMKADSIKCPDIVYSIIIIFLNIFLIIPDSLEFVVKDLLKLSASVQTLRESILIVVFNIVFFALGFYKTCNYERQCDEIAELSTLILKGDRRSVLEKYKKYQKQQPKDFEIIRSRGIFVFCSDHISKRRTLDDIPLNYRMLYIHKLYANIPRYRLTVILLTVLVLIVFLEYSVPMYIIGIFLTVDLCFAILFQKYVLPDLGKNKIIQAIEELKKEQLKMEEIDN